MQAWWTALTLLEKIFACIAIPSTLILVIQTVLLIFGIGDGDADADIDADAGGTPGDLSADLDLDVDGDGIPDVAAGGGFRLFSLKGIISFLAVMGWTGYTLSKSGVKTWITVTAAFLAGVAIMVIIALAFYLFSKLQANGAVNINHAIGKSGSVYLSVPAKRNGTGKVNIVVDDKLIEYEAVSDEDDALKYGTEVIVIGISGLNTLVVKKK